jgi:hypothetical protein
LTGLTSLQSLDLSRCEQLTAAWSPLASLTSLRELYLSKYMQPQVFVSYAWGDTSPTASEEDRQRQEVVERLC